jgi:hypothetical protein
MTPFLQLTAEDLYTKFGDNLASVAVVFPNNRARLFFSEHLYRAAGKPVWTPAFVTISDLFKEPSGLKPADPLEVVGYLYDLYIKYSGKEETFDEFYLWGEILLSDFDDVDKNMADARQLFRNIRELGEYTDTLEHLSEDQVAAIRLFFKNFNPDRKTELKERFLENWNILSDMYTDLQNLLTVKGLAYEGMLHRRVVEKLKEQGPSGFPFDTYAFVGFNVLNRCETELFSLLHKAGKALFYWDYDAFYLRQPQHEAGRFMRQNLEHFPNQLGKAGFDVFEKTPKHIKFIEASTENAQARFLPEWIEELKAKGRFNPGETAVVLCNEGLLLPVLHSVPDDIHDLNVTMGFPMTQTPIYNLVNELAALHTDGYLPGTVPRFNHRYLLPILQHPLIRQISEEATQLEQDLKAANSFRPSVKETQKDPVLTALFSPVETALDLAKKLLEMYRLLAQREPSESPLEPSLFENGETAQQPGAYDPLHAEALFRCHTVTSRLTDLMEKGLINVNSQTFHRLLQRVLSTTSIPFSGEPVRGLQIMGLLETRNLDFKNVLLLSVNEGMLPKGANETSFIPYNLRKAFGLTTMEHKDSIFSYYFFRLLQRAENISLVYSTATEGINRGEMSRFMLQLLVESSHEIETFGLQSGIELPHPRTLRIEKTPAILEKLRNLYDRNTADQPKDLSPTALNSLIDCSLRFYLRYLAHLKEAEEVSEDIDGAMLGNFFHHSAEYIYTSILLRKAGKACDTQAVEEAIEAKTINEALENGQLRGLIEADDLTPWIQGVHSIEQVVSHYFKKDFFRVTEKNAEPEYNGEQLIKRTLVTGFLKTLLQIDQERAPFTLVGLEKTVSGEISIGENIRVGVGGVIDRLDNKDNVLRILDYKTGGKVKKAASMEALFDSEAEDRASYVFQIMLYASILQKEDTDLQISPEILYIHQALKEKYSSQVEFGSRYEITTVNTFQPFASPFQEATQKLLNDLFDKSLPFKQTDHPEKCIYCDYKNLCRR